MGLGLTLAGGRRRAELFIVFIVIVIVIVAGPVSAAGRRSCSDLVARPSVATTHQASPEFKKAVESFPKGDDKVALQAWHDELIRIMKKILLEEGMPYRTTELKDGVEALEILADPRGPTLNRLISDLQPKLDGVRFVYSPRDLVNGKAHLAKAKFRSHDNLILLPHAFPFGHEMNGSIHHEVLHAVFFHTLKRGVNSLFYGWLKSVDGITPMWASKAYHLRMSFEEIATLSLNLRLHAISLGRLLEGNPTPQAIRDILSKMGHRANVLTEATRESSTVLHSILDGVSAGEIQVEFYEGGEGVVWAYLEENGISLELGLVTEDAKRALKEGATDRLLDLFIEKLTVLARVDRDVAEASEEFSVVLRSTLRLLDRGIIRFPELEALVRMGTTPRRRTLPYIIWDKTTKGSVLYRARSTQKAPRPEASPPTRSSRSLAQ